MGSTASSYLKLQGAHVTSEQVLSTDFDGFLQAVRPTFLVLQSAMCLGLTRTTAGAEQARTDRGQLGFRRRRRRSSPTKLAVAETTLASLAAAVGGANSAHQEGAAVAAAYRGRTIQRQCRFGDPNRGRQGVREPDFGQPTLPGGGVHPGAVAVGGSTALGTWSMRLSSARR